MVAIYLVVEKKSASAELVGAYLESDRGKVKKALAEFVQGAFATGTEPLKFEVGELLSNALVPPSIVDDAGEAVTFADSHQVPEGTALLFIPLLLDPDGALVTHDTLAEFNERVPGGRGAGADVGLQAAYLEAPQWSRRHGPGGGRGTRAEALRAIGGDFLDANELHGAGVNVVIVDQGLDRHRLVGNYVGGWPVGTRLPGALHYVRGVTMNGHGMLIARNVLAVAPAARLFDCPLIPGHIHDVKAFLSKAESVLNWVRAWIVFLRDVGVISGPWMVVNAWAIFDRSSEDPPGNYSGNGQHRFNKLIRRFGDDEIDVVFAAGNCGGYGPDRRCGLYDVGAGRSIYGAHAHSRALTVGSMRSDGLWSGSSSQGPGPKGMSLPANLIEQKPDLCAPSSFADPHDAHAFNGGTSTASAIAAGAIAALRSSPALGDPSSALMYEALRQGAVRAGAPKWDGRLGFGMLNAQRAFEFLLDGAPHSRGDC